MEQQRQLPQLLLGPLLLADRLALLPSKLRASSTAYSQSMGFESRYRTEPTHLISATDQAYPEWLRRCSDHPEQLFVKGTWPWSESQLDRPSLAVIGTRHPTVYGATATQTLIRQLAHVRPIIVSGAMVGIDSLSHHAALAQKLTTVGVLGYGFEHCYPSSQLELFETILANGGCLVSEYPPAVGPRKHQFVHRNRIIAGLAQMVIVVEAAEQSGTMITVQYALDYGRSVGAVPGPITNPYSVGTSYLLNQGAVCVINGQSVLAEIGWEGKPLLAGSSHGEHPHQPVLSEPVSAKLWETLQAQPQSIDQLAAVVSAPLDQILVVLSGWELAGWVMFAHGVWMPAR